MKLRQILVLLMVLVVNTVSAIDLPVFYRAPYFQDTFGKNEGKYTTHLAFRYMHGHSTKAWNDGENKTSLFSGYGYTDITALGLNYENPTDAITAYWDNGKFFDPTVYIKKNPLDGLIDFKGKFEMDEYDFTVQQDILWGFFVQVYVPIRDLHLKGIAYQNLGPAEIGAPDAEGHAVNVDDFMKNKLNPILKSVGISDYTRPCSESGVSEVLISAGWHKNARIISPIIKNIDGSVQIGALIPASGEKSQDISFSIPLGYDNFFGANFRANVFVGIFDWIGIGGYAGASMLFSEKRNRRVKTDSSQAGWIQLQMAYIDVEPGTEWDFGGYIQLGPVFGFSCMAGYSYARQEHTHYTNKDDNYLKTYSAEQINRDPWDMDYPTQPSFPYVVSKDGILNSDKRLRSWDEHTLHLIAKYEFAYKNFDPAIQLEYSYPFYGINTFPTDMWGGTASLMVKIKF